MLKQLLAGHHPIIATGTHEDKPGQTYANPYPIDASHSHDLANKLIPTRINTVPRTHRDTHTHACRLGIRGLLARRAKAQYFRHLTGSYCKRLALKLDLTGARQLRCFARDCACDAAATLHSHLQYDESSRKRQIKEIGFYPDSVGTGTTRMAYEVETTLASWKFKSPCQLGTAALHL